IFSPAPVMITARTASSVSTLVRAALSSRMSVSLIALAGGRLRVITAKLSSFAMSSVSCPMGGHSSQEDRGHLVGGLDQPIRALPQHPRGRQLIHGAEEHLGGELHRNVAAHLSGRHALVEDRADQVEVRGDLVGGGAAEELLALPELDLDHLGELRVVL